MTSLRPPLSSALRRRQTGRSISATAYSALMNERIAAETGGRVLLRIEDLDRIRCKPQFEAAIVDDLAWLGLRFPTPRRQSEHGDDYAAALARLDRQGLVYPCFCSRSEIARVSNGQCDPDGAPLYRGTCRAFSPAEARDRMARGDKAAFRLNMRLAVDTGPAGLCWTEYGEGAVPSQPSAAPEPLGRHCLTRPRSGGELSSGGGCR